jgi:hypothetical protein
MSDTVQANGIIIYHDLGSGYFPIACGISGSISVTTDKIELAPYTSGKWRNYEYGRTTGTISSSGLIVVQNGLTNYGPFDLLDKLLDHQKVLTKYVISDPLGNSKQYSVDCIVDEVSFNTEAGGVATYNMSMTMTSDPTFDQVVVNPDLNDVDSWSYNATGGETTITNVVIENVDVWDVRRNGIGLEIITTGTPTGSQVKYTAASGTLEFGMALGAGEWILTIYVS